MFRIIHLFKKAIHQESAIKFLLSRVLWVTKLCGLFVIDRGNYKIKFSPSSVSALYWEKPKYESDEESFLLKYLRTGDFVVDVGANVGTLTLLSASIVGGHGGVFSIEASPRTYKFLTKNITLNKFCNIETRNFAVGEKTGFIQFSNKLSDDQNEVVTNNGIKIKMETLDNIIGSKYKCIDLLKVDTEGYEKFVFDGAQNVLKKTKCIYFESCENHFKKYGYTTNELLNLLSKQGFELFFMEDQYISKIPQEYKSEKNENLLAIRDIQDFTERTNLNVINKNA